MNTDELTWFKSSYSDGEGGNCVEVAACPGAVHVRDSKDTHGPRLAFSPPGGRRSSPSPGASAAEWRAAGEGLDSVDDALDGGQLTGPPRRLGPRAVALDVRSSTARS